MEAEPKGVCSIDSKISLSGRFSSQFKIDSTSSKAMGETCVLQFSQLPGEFIARKIRARGNYLAHFDEPRAQFFEGTPQTLWLRKLADRLVLLAPRLVEIPK